MTIDYKFIYRKSPEHEPTLFGTRVTVARIIRNLEFGNNLEGIDTIIEESEGRITREMINNALLYYGNNKPEIDRFIEESIKRSGTIIRPNK